MRILCHLQRISMPDAPFAPHLPHAHVPVWLSLQLGLCNDHATVKITPRHQRYPESGSTFNAFLSLSAFRKHAYYPLSTSTTYYPNAFTSTTTAVPIFTIYTSRRYVAFSRKTRTNGSHESEADELAQQGPPKKKRRRQALSCTGSFSSLKLKLKIS